jgi:hypothetical protein
MITAVTMDSMYGRLPWYVRLSWYIRSSRGLLSKTVAKKLIPLLFASFAILGASTRLGICDPAQRISGPFVHDNLVVYLVHGPSKDGPVPMTLEEAVKDKRVRVYETGDVNELAIENLGDKEVFIQAGDIVTGGRQDRALTASLILPPHSGRVPLAALCVEPGRWTGRPAEDSGTFKAADAAVPSRAAKLLMITPSIAGAASSPPSPVPAPTPGASANIDSAYATAATAARSKQQEMWDEARRVENALSNNLMAPVGAPESPSSLRLALDNKTLRDAEKGFTDDLQKLGDQGNDIVGYVVAINGHLNSGTVYESNGLFRKMWPKQLQAGVVEAIAAGKPEKLESNTKPSTQEVEAFLASADAGKVSVQQLSPYINQETRDAAHTLSAETQRKEGSWVTRSYLLKTQ